MQTTKSVGYGVDTLILNVRYSDSSFLPVKQELDEKLQRELDYLQTSARQDENAVATDWYSHVLPSMQQDAINKLIAALNE